MIPGFFDENRMLYTPFGFKLDPQNCHTPEPQVRFF